MGSIARYLVTVALAAVITLSAFYLMHRLIDQDAAASSRPSPVTSIHFGPVDIPEPPRREPRKPPKPPERQEPPPVSWVVATVEPIERSLELERPKVDAPGQVNVFTGSFALGGPAGSGEARPIATVPPPYPRRAALEGIEGWVRMSIEIDATGRVSDVRVLESQPRSVFDDAAMGAVRRWTWKPALIDGEPRAQRVVQELIFSLDES